MANSLESTNFLPPSVYQNPNSENDLLPPYGSTLPVSQTPTQQVTKQLAMTPQTANNDVVDFGKYLNSHGKITSKDRDHAHESASVDTAQELWEQSIYQGTPLT